MPEECENLVGIDEDRDAENILNPRQLTGRVTRMGKISVNAVPQHAVQRSDSTE